MPFTSSYNRAQEDWEKYKQKIAASPGSSMASVQNAARAANSTPKAPAPDLGHRGAGIAQSTPVQPAAAGNPYQTSFVSNNPSDYYYGWDPGSNIMNDPEQANRAWAQHNNYGEGINEMLNRFDPMAALQAMGNPLSDFATPKGKLDAIGQFNSLLTGKQGTAGGFFDPRSMVANIAKMAGSWRPGSEETGGGTSGMNTGQYIDNPTLAPGDQVKNTIQFILSSLQGIVPVESYQAYANMLQREGLRFLDYRSKNPDTVGNASFLDWVVRVYGPGLGIF